MCGMEYSGDMPISPCESDSVRWESTLRTAKMWWKNLLYMVLLLVFTSQVNGVPASKQVPMTR